jgi:hypothetical protein
MNWLTTAVTGATLEVTSAIPIQLHASATASAEKVTTSRKFKLIKPTKATRPFKLARPAWNNQSEISITTLKTNTTIGKSITTTAETTTIATSTIISSTSTPATTPTTVSTESILTTTETIISSSSSTTTTDTTITTTTTTTATTSTTATTTSDQHFSTTIEPSSTSALVSIVSFNKNNNNNRYSDQETENISNKDVQSHNDIIEPQMSTPASDLFFLTKFIDKFKKKTMPGKGAGGKYTTLFASNLLEKLRNLNMIASVAEKSHMDSAMSPSSSAIEEAGLNSQAADENGGNIQSLEGINDLDELNNKHSILLSNQPNIQQFIDAEGGSHEQLQAKNFTILTSKGKKTVLVPVEKGMSEGSVSSVTGMDNKDILILKNIFSFKNRTLNNINGTKIAPGASDSLSQRGNEQSNDGNGNQINPNRYDEMTLDATSSKNGESSGSGESNRPLSENNGISSTIDAASENYAPSGSDNSLMLNEPNGIELYQNQHQSISDRKIANALEDTQISTATANETENQRSMHRSMHNEDDLYDETEEEALESEDLSILDSDLLLNLQLNTNNLNENQKKAVVHKKKKKPKSQDQPQDQDHVSSLAIQETSSLSGDYVSKTSEDSDEENSDPAVAPTASIDGASEASQAIQSPSNTNSKQAPKAASTSSASIIYSKLFIFTFCLAVYFN